ncbi:BZIP family transcription factor [Colletotrichum higginsianum IMI 349063]|uniref:BZIP family transcription factor n=1 Tax=Colletotrichum higginsianum (strain IMI 349063) TaxID=759273 RepID=A0A1B7Y4I2_COLHI|nr:BZIP family transcription factor [Colletotrichum higginsianum IMI 349063]OBR06949.1 BZIP family transcription factor [Colletotrichum higginsianum IMI 349063]
MSVPSVWVRMMRRPTRPQIWKSRLQLVLLLPIVVHLAPVPLITLRAKHMLNAAFQTSQRPPSGTSVTVTHRHRRLINQQAEGYAGGFGALDHPPLSSTSVFQRDAAPAPTSNQLHPDSQPPLFSHPSYASHVQRHHNHEYPNAHHRQDTQAFYCNPSQQHHHHHHQQQQKQEPPYQQQQQQQQHHHRPELHSHPRQSQEQYRQLLLYPSPVDSASVASSSPEPHPVPLLRHPHDPRLLQAQIQIPITGTGFEFLSAQEPGYPPTAVDLVPIRFPHSDPTHIPTEPQAAFSLSGPSGSGSGPDHLLHYYNNNNINDDNDDGYGHGDGHGDDDFLHRHSPGVHFPDGSPLPFMQNPKLSILNAESYDDGTLDPRAARSLPAGRPGAVTDSESSRSKKRPKAQSSDTDAGHQEEEEKKRSRGRPRLDTNDETAKDRRRTQIRLAQRAYRNRKETAIQSLEKKVDELRRTNEEMSKEFMKLYDFAVSKGMHESTPEFGLQLQSTTEKFVSLARKSSLEPEGDDELPASQENEGEAAQDTSPSRARGQHSDKSASPAADKPRNPGKSLDMAATTATTTSTTTTTTAAYGGYMASYNNAPLHSNNARPHPHGLTAVHTTSWAVDNQSQAPHSMGLSQAPLGYEIVTEATPDNASFPFGMSIEHQSLMAPASDSHGGPSEQPLSEALFSMLSGPSSYAYQERTFGRRLQRSTLEKGYLLMRMSNPPPSLVSSAFGFCLLFEPRERILERLANCLSVNQRETMFNWRFPFLHLGGGGTWFGEMNEMNVSAYPPIGGGGGDGGPDGSSSSNSPRRIIGNQGTAEPRRQKVDSLFGLGPWDAETEEMRDLRIDQEHAKLRTTVPGFEGDFYDADEVEWVLQQRGVVIPPASDFVTADIDPADFSIDTASGGAAAGSSAQGTAADIVDTMTRDHPPNPLEAYAREWLGVNLKPTKPTDVDLGENIDPGLRGGADSSSQLPTAAGANKRSVTINVGVLVQEIGLRSVCLGRSPGVRPKDLNISFWASLVT